MIYPEHCEILAPLSGYTDEPYRRLCRRYGCFFCFAPLIDVSSVVYSNPRNPLLLLRAPDEPWLGVQMVGSDPEKLRKAALSLNTLNFDVLDLNMGCPVPKVTRRGAGAALARNPECAVRCVDVLVKTSRFPVTAKIRIADCVDPAPTVRLATQLVNAGIQALTIHGRTAEAVYSGLVYTLILDEVRQAIDIPVIANGGVFSFDDAQKLRTASNCTRVMVARGSIGNPWIFREISASGNIPPPSHDEICQAIEEQVDGMLSLYGQCVGMRNARKIILAYLAGRGYRRSLRDSVTRLCTLTEFTSFMDVVRKEGPTSRYLAQVAERT